MKFAVALLAIPVLAACTTVRVHQVGDCWVQTKSRVLGSTSEQVGPCLRHQPDWSDDRYTRLAQECIAQADYQWMTRALALWQRGEPLPPREPQDAVNRQCFESAVAITARENDELRSRLDALQLDAAEAKKTQKSLEERLERGFEQLRDANTKLADHLGEAAKKASTPATATASATADGRATTHSRSEQDAGNGAIGGTGKPAAPVPTHKRARGLELPRPTSETGTRATCDPSGHDRCTERGEGEVPAALAR
jgi:hypothetical protein